VRTEATSSAGPACLRAGQFSGKLVTERRWLQPRFRAGSVGPIVSAEIAGRGVIRVGGHSDGAHKEHRGRIEGGEDT